MGAHGVGPRCLAVLLALGAAGCAVFAADLDDGAACATLDDCAPGQRCDGGGCVGAGGGGGGGGGGGHGGEGGTPLAKNCLSDAECAAEELCRAVRYDERGAISEATCQARAGLPSLVMATGRCCDPAERVGHRDDPSYDGFTLCPASTVHPGEYTEKGVCAYWYAPSCEGGICMEAIGVARGLGDAYVCTRPCESTADCPFGMACAPPVDGHELNTIAKVCTLAEHGCLADGDCGPERNQYPAGTRCRLLPDRRPPYCALPDTLVGLADTSAPCAADAECISNLCEGGACRALCQPTPDSDCSGGHIESGGFPCPEGESCRPVDPANATGADLHACLPAP